MGSDLDIAIVGMACVFPKANNRQRFWANLVNGVDAITDRPPDRWRDHRNFDLPPDHDAFLPCQRGGYIDPFPFDPVKYGVLPNLVKHGDPDQFFMLALIDAALHDAGIAEESPLRERTDVLIGRGGYATGKLVELTMRAEMFDIVLELIERRSPELLAGGRRAELEAYFRSTLTPKAIDNVSTAVSNISASRTANRLNLGGSAYTVDAACASSLIAAETAMTRLRAGQCDVAIAAGLFLSMSPTFLYVFTSLGACSRQQMIRPMDRRADGLLVGEGGGALVLKRLEDATAAGDQVYAVIKGAASASDAKDVDVLAPSTHGQVRALERAYADANVDPATINYLEIHGTGTLVGDEVELASIKRFFGTAAKPACARAMGSVKSMIGHTMPAAGIAALIKTALSLSNKVLPPSLHCEEPRPELDDCPFYVITQTRPWVHSPTDGPRRAGVNAFGFGGINCHVVLEEAPERTRSAKVVVPRPIEPGVKRETELFAFTAPTPDAMLGRLRALSTFLDASAASSLAAAADVAFSLLDDIDLSQPVKLAIIAEDLVALRARIDVCLERISRGGDFEDHEDVYYSASAARHEGKIAFVFPGMGFPGLIGSYPDHLLELCLHYPEVRAEFDFFEDRDRHPEDDIPTSAIFSPPPHLPEDYRKALKGRLAPPKVDQAEYLSDKPWERYLAAMGVTLANWIGWVLLRKFEIPVDMATGQSQGEMAAVCAVGVSDFHKTAPSFWKVLNIDVRGRAGGRLCFAWATGEKLAPLLAENPDTYLAIYMSPEGTIMGGDREGLQRIAEKLREEQILVQLLPYPPIHTPYLGHLKDELVAELGDADFDLQRPTIDLYSSITAEKYPTDPAAIRETLMLNLDHPLRIWQTIRRMYDDGARIFVQVGGGHMAAHLKTLLAEGSEAISAALDVDVRNPLTQLNHLCATLFTSGVPLKLTPLFEYRSPQRIDLRRPAAATTAGKMAVPLRIDWSPLYSPNAARAGGNAVAEPFATEPSHLAASPATHDAPPDQISPQPAASLVDSSSATTAASPESLAMTSLAPDVIPGFDHRLPVLGAHGRVASFEPEKSIVIERRLDLNEDLFLEDHLFVYAENKPLEARLPILPLTFSMEFLAETASMLSPGLGLIGFENVRGHRWIGLRDRTTDDIRIEASVISDDPETGVRRVKATFMFEDKPGFSGTAVFGHEYRDESGVSVPDPQAGGTWPFATEQVYGDRYMFHGPRFFTVAELGHFGNPCASINLRAMPRDRLFASLPEPILFTDPCMMDGIGQIIGLWCWAHEQYILPTGLDKVEFLGPTPPVGAIVPVRMEVTEFNNETKQIRCNMEFLNESGAVWARVIGWAEWIMNWATSYANITRLPSRYLLGEEIPLGGDAVCVSVGKGAFSGSDIDWAGRIFLHDREIPAFREIPSLKKRKEMLMSRAAVKDAVRLWWVRRHGGEYPQFTEISVGHNDAGAPFLEPEGDPSLPRISIAHHSDLAVGIASAEPVGVDLEPVSARAREILAQFATDAEIATLDNPEIDPEGEWPTRLWCAKEAVGKLLGAGLGGRPKDFEAIDVDGEGRLLILHEPTGARHVARTTRIGDWIIAVAGAASVGDHGENWNGANRPETSAAQPSAHA